MIGDRYEIVERIGKGGQGTSYLGRDTRDGRTVLIKQLNIADADEWKSIELFQREARVLQQLEHPAIPRVLDALVDDDKEGVTQFYLVREFVEGTPLDEAISKGLVMEYDEVLSLTRELLEVLAYLHSLQPPVIHRDIKPSNLIRRPDGSLVLVDFGAVCIGVAGDEYGTTVVGTPGYIPPEQAMGRPAIASDLYALGATLIHILAGRAPSELPMKGLRLDYHDHIKVPELFEGLLESLLEPNVEDRCQSAKDALSALTDPAPPKQRRVREKPKKKKLSISKVETLTKRVTIHREGDSLTVHSVVTGFSPWMWVAFCMCFLFSFAGIAAANMGAHSGLTWLLLVLSLIAFSSPLLPIMKKHTQYQLVLSPEGFSLETRAPKAGSVAKGRLDEIRLSMPALRAGAQVSLEHRGRKFVLANFTDHARALEFYTALNDHIEIHVDAETSECEPTVLEGHRKRSDLGERVPADRRR